MRIIYALLIGLVSLVSNGQAQSDEEQIREQIKEFSKNLMDGKLEDVVAAYTHDAKIMPPRTKILEGKELAEYWNPVTPGTWKTTYHKIIPEEIKIWRDEAYDYGYYEGSSSDGESTSDWKGKYVIVWRKEGGIWKIYLDIWNRVDD